MMLRTKESTRRLSGDSTVSSPSTASSDKSFGDTTNSSSAQQVQHPHPPEYIRGDGSPRSPQIKYHSPRSKSTGSTGSKTFETGKVSAFSSVADLKAHLRKNELMREERRRKRELYRQQQLLLRKQEEQHQSQQQSSGTEQQQGAEPNQLPNPLLLSSDPKSNQELHHRRINFVQAPNNADIILLSSMNQHNNTNIHSGFNTPSHHILQTIQEPKQASIRDNFELGNNKVWSDHAGDHNTVSSPGSVYITTSLHNDETSEITHDTQAQSSVSSVPSMTRDAQKNSFSNRGEKEKNKKKRKKFSVTKPIRKALKKFWKKMQPIFGKKETVNLQRSKKGSLC